MEEDKYCTPNFDKVLEEEGYVKFEKHPLYIKKGNGNEEFKYLVVFTVDFNAYCKLYENNYSEENKEKFKQACLASVDFAFTRYYFKELKYDQLVLLTIDFYSHQNDNEKAKEMIDFYNKISFQEYK